MPVTFDSAPETRAHISRVRTLLLGVVDDLTRRAWRHDASKLEAPEKALFDQYTPLLRQLKYGSPEYQASLEAMGPALQHHYEHNDHHPEHFANGIRGMSLVEMLEMLIDWKAAGERHADGGDILTSIEKNAARFGYGPEIATLLVNTARYLGWLEESDDRS